MARERLLNCGRNIIGESTIDLLKFTPRHPQSSLAEALSTASREQAIGCRVAVTQRSGIPKQTLLPESAVIGVKLAVVSTEPSRPIT